VLAAYGGVFIVRFQPDRSDLLGERDPHGPRGIVRLRRAVTD
jgi:hypothetical protein